MLTVTDVLTRVRRTFGDESSAQVTQSDVIRWINDAQREAVMQNEGLLQKVGNVSSVAGTTQYAIPTDLFTLSHLYYRESATSAYYIMKWMSLKDFSEYVDGWDGSSFQGVPLIYTQETNTTFTVFPKPEASVANGFKLIYSRYATDVVDTASTIDLPDFLGTYVVNYCLMQAYEMDEDWESAEKKAQQIQGDLDFNNNRKFWFGRDAYPTINVGRADQEGEY
jgi:hypothetical protein